MKKIFGIILILCMMMSFLTVFADDVKKESSVNYEEMNELLKLTGITDNEFLPGDREVSRGEFAAYLIRSRGLTPYYNDYGKSVFSDVNDETLYASEIMLAKDMGFINGYSDGSFRPEKSVSVIEAAVSFIRLLGYDIKAEGMGGYPSGYYEVIRQTGLLKNITAAYTDKLTTRTAVHLIYNALHTKVLEKVSYGDEERYESSNGNTLLYSSFKIAYKDGTIEGVDITNLFGENDLPAYYVYLGLDKFYTEYDMNYLLGYYVRAYYTEDESGYTIKLAVKDSRKNNEQIISIEDVNSISGGIITTLDENGKESRYSYKRTAPVIFNGTNTKVKFDTDIYKDENGYNLNGFIKLLDNDNDGKADVVFVEAYRDMIVGKINQNTAEVYDYFNRKIKFNLDTESDEPYVLIYNEENELMETAELTEGMSLSIYCSKDDAWQAFIRAYVSTAKVTGKIDYIENESVNMKIVLNGEEYKVSKYAIDNSLNIIVGRTVDATLNHYGEIAALKYTVNPGDYSFAMICASGQEPVFEGKTLVKLMTSSGDFSTLTVADKIKIDGRSLNISNDTGKNVFASILKTASEKITGTVNSNYYFQIVKYGVDSDGCINYIDTVLDKEGNVMSSEDIKADNELFFAVADGKYYTSSDMIAQKTLISTDCFVYMYPERGSEAEQVYYDVRDRSFFKNDTDYTGIAYFKDNNDGFEASIFMKKYTEASISGDITNFKNYIVTKVTDCVNEDGEKRKKWYIFSNGAVTSYLVDPKLNSATTVESEIISADEVKAGDVIYYRINSVTEEIEAFIIGYSVEDDKIYNISATYNGYDKAHILKSTKTGIQFLVEDKVGYKEGTTFIPTVDSNGKIKVTEATDVSSALVFNNVRNSSLVTIYDAKRKTATIGNYIDIVGYFEDNDEYDRDCLVRWYHPNSKMYRELIIIKR